MAVLQSDDKERVLEATDIVRLIGDHVALRARGREYVGICPFHDDHKPSMTVVPHKQIYKCFSCNAGGDAFTFVMEYHKMGFREALEYLAQRANIELRPTRQRQPGEEPETSRADLINANQTAVDFFRAILANEEHGAAARQIIEQRSISDDMVKVFAIGASPARWDGLLQTIRAKDLDERTFAEAGLIKTSERGKVYDTFRNRLMFPIQDQIGRVIAFGGRRIDDEEDPKYLNSPESRLFDKSSTIYGLAQAKDAIQASRTAVVTEGYMDVIACHQAGFRNVVATLGTAMTGAGGRILERLCDSIVLLFDGDDAGQRAADRAVEVFFASSVDVRIAILDASTGAKDPDELLKSPGGVEAFGELLAGGTGALEFRLERLRARLRPLSVPARERAVEEEMRRLGELGIRTVRPIRREIVIRKIASILDIEEQAVRRALSRRTGGRMPEPTDDPADLDPRAPEERLLGCILAEPSLALAMTPEDRDLVRPDAYREGPVRALALAVFQLEAEGRSPGLAQVRLIVDGDVLTAAIGLCDEVERQNGFDTERVHEMWADNLARARERVQQTKDDGSLEAMVRLQRDRLATRGERWSEEPEAASDST